MPLSAYEQLKEKFQIVGEADYERRIALNRITRKEMTEQGYAHWADKKSRASKAGMDAIKDPSIKFLLAQAAQENLSEDDRLNLKLMKWQWTHEAAIPEALEGEYMALCARPKNIWRF